MNSKIKEKMEKVRAAKSKVSSRLNPMEKARLNPQSRSLAINANCFNCMGGTLYDSFVTKEIRKNVKKCTSERSCPLWRFRPWKL